MVMKTRQIVQVLAGVLCLIALSVGLSVGLTKDKGEIIEEPDEPGSPWESFRLPTSIIPKHYDIVLKPDVRNDISFGFETIGVEVLRETSIIIIHAIQGGFTDIKKFVVRQGGIIIGKKSEFYYNQHKQQYYVVQLTDYLAVGGADLEIEWTSDLVGTLVGINKVTYYDKGVEEYIIATKFEPTYAREAFPCFDEPAMKAVYDLAMYHEASHQGLWNMPVTLRDCSCSDCQPGQCRTQFEASPPMGTYQPTFIIHNMDFISATYERPGTSDSIPLRVYAPFEKIGQAAHALSVQKYVIEHYENEFRIQYPLPKLDLIAIPDFVTGAMEQWGLITYRETSLLYDPSEGSTSSKQSTTSTIAHEMVHQWFGNLVTMEWWDNIWLNEGFATFYKYEAMEAAFPEDDWDTKNQQIYNDIIYSLNRDVVASSRPIIADVRNPDEITAAFDWVIYQKGASIIYMIKEALGAEAYNSAILNYLERCQYSVATEVTFFEEIQKVLDDPTWDIHIDGNSLNATELWMPFLRQSLYPLMDVSVTGSGIKVEQVAGPFLHNPESHLPESEYNWQYPMILRYESLSGENTERRLLKAGEIVEIQGLQNQTVKLNTHQTGFYRVKYDSVLRTRLRDMLMFNHTDLHEMDRTGLMDDAFHLAISGAYNYEEALDMIDYISQKDIPETSYYAWNLFSSRTSYMCQQMLGTDTGEQFLEYFRPAVEHQFSEFGFSVERNESHTMKKMRSTIISLSVSFGVQGVNEEAMGLFSIWKLSGGIDKPSPDVRGTVYNLGVELGNFSDWMFVHDLYLEEEVASEKKQLMRALAASTNVTVIDYMLNTMATNKTIILEQDFFTFIAYISYSENGNKMAFDWTRVHWNELVERFGTGDRNFGRMVPGIVDGYNTPYGLWAATDFFSTTVAGAGEGPRANAIAQIESNIIWRDTYIGDIQNWLDKKSSNITQ